MGKQLEIEVKTQLPPVSNGGKVNVVERGPKEAHNLTYGIPRAIQRREYRRERSWAGKSTTGVEEARCNIETPPSIDTKDDNNEPIGDALRAPTSNMKAVQIPSPNSHQNS